MPTPLRTLASYIPSLIIQRHHSSNTPLIQPVRHPLLGAGLLADISGFTAFTEKVARESASGVEELTRILNVTFEHILDLIQEHGGDVVKFAGDALLALWPTTPEDQASAALRATQCALAIHQRMERLHEVLDNVQLVLRIGVAIGNMSTLQVGGVYGRWEFLVTGQPLVQMNQAERLAKPGQVVVTPEAWQLIQPFCVGEEVESESSSGFVRIAKVHQPIPAQAAQIPELRPSMDVALRSFIPGAVISRLVAGETSWLAELRRVTVLFINLPTLDHTISIDAAQEVTRTLQTVLYRYEGSVNKITVDNYGTTLIAALGLPPLAHEDDATRGVQTALSISQALSEMGLPCAIGIASGQAFCGEIGSNYRREYTMIGGIVNLAARLMQAAQGMLKDPNKLPISQRDTATQAVILCDQETYSQAQQRIVFKTLQAIPVRGRSEPIPIFMPLHENTIDPRQRSPKLNGEMIGRINEQATLTAHLHELLRGDPGAVTLIEGEAGMGKSTLIERFVQLASDHKISVLMGSGDATERTTPYHAWRSIFAQIFELNTSGTLETRLRDLIGADEMELAPLLNAVLPLNLPETQLTRQLTGLHRAETTRDLLLRVFQRAVSYAPQIVVLEDAHWLDSASLDLTLAVSQRVHPLLMVIAFRPFDTTLSARERFSYQQLRKSAKTHILLDALTPEESIALVCQRLGVQQLDPPIAQLIQQKTQGHPFFSEELAYALRDTGLITIENNTCKLTPEADLNALTFPNTVQGAIISRVDRLSSTQQLTLKVASVVGRAFSLPTIHAVYPLETDNRHIRTDLETLSRLDITPLERATPEPTYIFKHAITQEVVYNLMLFAQRRQLHRAVAEWYESNFGNPEQPPLVSDIRQQNGQTNSLATYYPLLAHHWSKAGNTVKAIDYFEKAGRIALSISALHEAQSAFGQALQLIETIPNVLDAGYRQAILTQLQGEAYHYLGDFANAYKFMRNSLDLMLDLNDLDGVIDSRIWLGRITVDMGNYHESREYLEAALELSRARHDRARTAQALTHLAHTAMSEAEYAQAQSYYQESLVLFTALNDQHGTAQVFHGMGSGAIEQRMYDVARYCYEESYAIRKSLGDRWGMGNSLNLIGWVSHLQGDFEAARQCYRESLDIMRAIGDRRGIATILNNLGFTLYELNDIENAVRSFDEAMYIALDIGAIPIALEGLVGIARQRAMVGYPEAAAELLGLALSHPASNNNVKFQVEIFLEKLQSQLSPDRLQEALQRGAQEDFAQITNQILKQTMVA